MPKTAQHHSNHIEIQIHLEQDETKTHRLILQKTGGEQITLPLADLIDLPDNLKKTRYDTHTIQRSGVLIGQQKITLGLNHQESNELEQRLRRLIRQLNRPQINLTKAIAIELESQMEILSADGSICCHLIHPSAPSSGTQGKEYQAKIPSYPFHGPKPLTIEYQLDQRDDDLHQHWLENLSKTTHSANHAVKASPTISADTEYAYRLCWFNGLDYEAKYLYALTSNPMKIRALIEQYDHIRPQPHGIRDEDSFRFEQISFRDYFAVNTRSR